jgi:hypothetical protein
LAENWLDSSLGSYTPHLLAIRKGAGNDETRHHKWSMLEPFMNDAREQRDRERLGS